MEGAPVGDHQPFKAPFLPEDIGQKLLVVGAVGAVDLVVGAHDRGRLGNLHCQLKGSQVQLPQGAVIENAVGGKTLVFLTVAGKVLQRCAHTVFLQAPNLRGGQQAGQQRILGEVFKIPPAAGITFQIGAGAKDQSYAGGRGFRADGRAHFLQQLQVPGAGGQGRRGETGGRQGVVDAQHIGRALLLTQTVGAVAHEKAWNVVLGHGLGGPGGFAGTQGDLVLQAHLGNRILVLHSKTLLHRHFLQHTKSSGKSQVLDESCFRILQ